MKQQTIIKIKKKDMFGKSLYYPNCLVSIELCKIKRRMSFTQKDIEFLEQHFDIETTEFKDD